MLPGLVPARAVRVLSAHLPLRSTWTARAWPPVEPGVVRVRVVLPYSVQPSMDDSASCWSALSRLVAVSAAEGGAIVARRRTASSAASTPVREVRVACAMREETPEGR